MAYIPYNPATDRNQYFAQMVSNALTGVLGRYQKKRQGLDIQDIGTQLGIRLPQARTSYGQQLAASLLPRMMMSPLQQAQRRHIRAQTRTLRRPKSKMKELMDEGYSAKDAKLIMDISHGLKPRASTTKSLAQKELPEQLSFWQTIFNKTLDPAWGGDKPTEAMDSARQLAKQNMDRITREMGQAGRQGMETPGFGQTDFGFEQPEFDTEGLPEGTLDVSRTMPTAPRPEFEEFWPKLTGDQKNKVTRALMRGASIEDIITALKLEGIE